MTQSWPSDRFASLMPKKPTIIPVVRLSGPIGAVTPLRPGVNLATLAEPLKRAFSVKFAPAVAIIINSPGGSAVQSTLLMRRIRALAEEKKKKLEENLIIFGIATAYITFWWHEA